MIKYFKRRKLEKFIKIISKQDENYIQNHKVQIDCIQWLIGYYRGITLTPKEIIEQMIKVIFNHRLGIKKISELQEKNYKIWIDILSEWIYNNKIVGFENLKK